MTTTTIGMIGAGRVARILLGGWRHAGLRPARIRVTDPDVNAASRVRDGWPEVVEVADLETVARQDVVFLAVHPPAIPAVLAAIAPRMSADTLVVYLGSKVTLEALRAGLGGHGALARVIPNAPSLVGAGYNPYACAATLSQAARATLRSWFEPLGDFVEVAESKLEGYVLLTGMGPTYLWFQLETLRELGREFGLDDAEIAPALERMLQGAARTLFASGLSAAETMDLVPVKPLAEDAAAIEAAYRARLRAVYARIRP